MLAWASKKEQACVCLWRANILEVKYGLQNIAVCCEMDCWEKDAQSLAVT